MERIKRPKRATPNPTKNLRTSPCAPEPPPEAVSRLLDLGKSIDEEIAHGLMRSFRVSQIVPVIAHAVGVFGDEHKASHWLSTPLSLFANRSPSEVLQDEGGIEAVEQVLTRIEHNIPS